MAFSPEIGAFLREAGWDDAAAQPLQADFSSRRFTRLRHTNGATAVLMQAAPEQKTPAFVRIAGLLRELGLAAPNIYAARPEQGLVLMADLGDTTLGRLLDEGRDPWPLYHRATEVLVELHKGRLQTPSEEPSLPLFNADLFTQQVELFLDGYIPYTTGRAATPEEREAFRAAWQETLAPLNNLPRVLMLRDYMPDNLMDVPGRPGVLSVGLLDFQDGGLGPLPYDLASLCEVVRRDGGDALQDAVLSHYTKLYPILPLAELRRACRILSAQRHLRILGIIAPRPEKHAFLPRIMAHVRRLLEDEELEAVRRVIAL